jgi:Tfp pilus assembly protein PilX
MSGKNRAGNERGIVLIIALMLLLVLTIIGINSISTTNFESIISGNERLANIAFYSAEAGIQVGLNQIPDTTPIPRTEISPSTDTYYAGSVAYVGLGQSDGDDTTWTYKRYQVNAGGEAMGGNRQIEIQTRLGPLPAGTGYNN